MKWGKIRLIHRRDLLIAFGALMVLFTFVPIFTYLYFVRDLSTKETIMNRNNTGVVLLDRHGTVFFKFYEAQLRTFTPISQIPQVTQEAILAAEDKDFYSHPGFSIKSIAGALVADIKQRKLAYGGSTITQQLVKNSLLNSNRNFLRKYQELVLAQEIERRYSKQEILEMYLNSVYFGHGAFGIQAASQAYFGKDAKDLDLAESSLLAGLVTAPSQLDPIKGDKTKALSRQKFVLDEMAQKKFITTDQASKAAQTNLSFVNPDERQAYQAPHFALMVRDQLIQKYGEEEVIRGGWTVYTTLDLPWQQFAEKTVADQVTKLKPNRVTNGAAAVIVPQTGEVRVLVGSKDWFDDTFGKYNIATADRPPGSSFKPIIYAAALEKRIITPGTVLKDDPITYTVKGSPPYKPQNYDRKYRGPVLVRRALVNSLNVPAIEVFMKTGFPTVNDLAKRLGITTLDPDAYYGPAAALGTFNVQLIQMTNAYATFANNGQYNPPVFYTEILDKRNTSIYHYNPQPKQVVSPEVSFLIASILSDNAVRAESFGTALNISRQAAAKTGTTEDYKDAWIMGFTPQLAIGAWVGNNDNTTMDQVAGSLGPAPIWKTLMEQFHKGVPEQKFTPPSGIVAKSVCKSSGLLLKEASSSGYTEYFLKGTEPTRFCTVAAPQPSVAPGTSPAPTPPPSQPPADDKKDKEKKD